jgi:hypothetical protein|tara:strand:+ start:596 stop:826 length:231 start_codon:yes stop_codon:yes gene_type:complete
MVFIDYNRKTNKMKDRYYIKYFSKSDGKKIKRPYNPHAEMQHEFIAGSGNLCKRYWDESKNGLRTANAPWTISVRK